MKKLHLFILLLPFFSFSQKLNTDLFKKMKARSIGPAVMSGRVTAIDAVWSNPEIIYVGAASGGVWKTENGGGTFTPIFDEQPNINIGSLAIQQSNPSVIWVGTGEGNPRNSINIGAGIYKTIDGGRTWKMMGLEKSKNIHRIYIDPSNPNIVYAGVIGNPYGEHPERGVFKTTDGGETWQKVLFTNEKSGISDMIMDSKNPNKLFAAMWEHRRTPWGFTSGGAGSGLYMTLDAGKSWKKLGKNEGLPEGDYGRIGLAQCREVPNRVYALIEATKNALYRSDDGGFKWEKFNEKPEDVTNRPFYFNEIFCDPKNENRLYSIFQDIAVSEDGGKNFRITANSNQAHSDHHALWIHPENPSLLIDGNDGGITISRDKGKKWVFADALPLGQFYHINVDNAIPYNIYGGLQDNGSWQGPAYTWYEGGIRNYYWKSVNGGDGFDVVPDPENSRFGYAMSQGGNLARYDTQTGNSEFVRPPVPDTKTRLRFNWNAAIALDPFDNSTIYYGSQFVHKSTDKGKNWETISNDLTINNPEHQKQDQSGGLTIDITSAENHNTILTIAPSTKEKGVIWVGTDDGNVQLTRDGGKTWTNLNSKIMGFPKEGWICQIQASKHSAGEAFVTVNNYRQGDFAPYIFRTKDYGMTWQRVLDDTKAKGYALCFLQDPIASNLWFCGTEHGLWVSMDEGKSWTQWKSGMPSVSTMDMTIQEREADLVIATFGRGIYVLDNIRPLRKMAQNVNVTNQKLAVFEPAEAYLVNQAQAPGYWFAGDGFYEGDNRRMGGIIPYFAQVPKKEEKKAEDKSKTDVAKTDIPKQKVVKFDTVFAKIYDEANKLIRSVTHVPDSTGMQQVVWDLGEKGIRMPGGQQRGRRGGGGGDPRGMDALPGRYKVVLSFGDQKDSTYITVKSDPRATFDRNAAVARRASYEKLSESIKKMNDAMTKLDKASEATERISAQIKDQEGKEMEDLRKTVKEMQDSIKLKKELIIPKALEKQGYGRPYVNTASTKAQEAIMYLRSRSNAPANTENSLMSQAEAMTNEAVSKIDVFVNGQWAEFRKKIDGMKWSFFKD
jgi:photosystem II stability/assembly factor-like uncharacterized protein